MCPLFIVTSDGRQCYQFDNDGMIPRILLGAQAGEDPYDALVYSTRQNLPKTTPLNQC